MKKVTFLIALVSLFWLSLPQASKIYAQGTFGCALNPSTNVCDVDPKKVNCSPAKDYLPRKNDCKTTTPGNCNSSTYSCVKKRIKASCPAGYTAVGNTSAPFFSIDFWKVFLGQVSYVCCNNSVIQNLPSWAAKWSKCNENKANLTQAVCPAGYELAGPDSMICNLSEMQLVDTCEKLPTDQQNACYNCTGRPWEKSTKGAYTALGCIKTDPTEFMSWILKNAIALGGGIAFLLMIFGAFQVIISGGDPEKLNSGKEIITSAIAGLIMIIFSVFLLRLIGVEILHIPNL